jgi:dTDP-4-amino-4,6-dideoxygalactose transaminase
MFDKITEFERDLAEFTGAPYAVMTDCCTHAIELCLRYDKVRSTRFTPYTYLSVPMTMHKLGISYSYTDDEWIGEYPFYNTRIWDSARRLEQNMYKPGNMQCLSFGYSKPLDPGRGGAILLDDVKAYEVIKQMRYDGRDLTFAPWQKQQVFRVGYHYRPTIEEAELALAKLKVYTSTAPKHVDYPDLREIKITE